MEQEILYKEDLGAFGTYAVLRVEHPTHRFACAIQRQRKASGTSDRWITLKLYQRVGPALQHIDTMFHYKHDWDCLSRGRNPWEHAERAAERAA